MLKRKPRFVFTLRENYLIAKETGIIGFCEDIAEKAMHGADFLFGVSLAGAIFGPFVQRDYFVDQTDMGFIRLVPSEPGGLKYLVAKAICPYRFRFIPRYPVAGIKMGLKWWKACEIAGLPPAA